MAWPFDQPSNTVNGVDIGGAQQSPIGAINPTATFAKPGTFSMDSMFGYADPNTGVTQNGWFAPTVNAIAGAGQTILGYQQLKDARDNSKRQWEAWALNYDNNRTLVNDELRARQQFRNSSGGVAAQDVNSYMAATSIKPRG